MKTQILLLSVAGFISLLFVVFHLLFYRMFNWENTLDGLSSVNRAIFTNSNSRFALNIFRQFCSRKVDTFLFTLCFAIVFIE